MVKTHFSFAFSVEADCIMTSSKDFLEHLKPPGTHNSVKINAELHQQICNLLEDNRRRQMRILCELTAAAV